MCSEKQPRCAKTIRNPGNLLPWIAVAIIIAVVAGLRLRLLDVPLERDEGEYAYAGQLLLQGTPPYLNVYNMKMPGIYAAYALILAVFGQTQTGIHLALLVINSLTIILVFLLAKHLIDSFTGVFAAAAFAAISLSQSVQGIFANAEHFVIFFALAGILLLLYALDRDNPLILFAASLLLGIGFLMKQHGAVIIVFAGLYMIFHQLRRRPFKPKPILAKTGLFVIGASLPFGVTCLLLRRAGVFDKFWFWTFVYAREYVSSQPIQEGLVRLKTAMTDIAGSAVMIFIFAGIGLLTLILNKKLRHLVPFLIGFLLFSFLATCPGFYFRQHYFVLLLPAVALMSGVGFWGVRQALNNKKPVLKKDLIAVLLMLVVPLCTLYQQKDYLLAKSPDVVSRMSYGRNPFPESLKIAEYIKANSSSNDTIAILGSEPQILFYADRHSATSYIYVYPLMESHPYALQMQKEMIQQIEKAQPKFLVFVKISFSWLTRPDSNKMILNWSKQYATQHYKLVGIVNFMSLDNITYHWGPEAARYSALPYPSVMIFERTPTPPR